MGILHYITSQLFEKTDKNLPLDQATRSTTISFAAIISSLFYLVFGVLGFLNHNYILTAVLGAGILFSMAAFLKFRRGDKTDLYANIILFLSGAVLLYCFASGGAFGTGFLWIFPFPILSIALKGISKGTRISAVFLVLVVIITLVSLYVDAVFYYELTFSLRLIGSYLAIHAIVYIYEYVRRRNLTAMEKWIADSKDESKRKDDFLSKLSHQIRTPLNNITLISTLVDRTKLPPDQQDLFDTIIASTNNLVNVVNNIVQISAIDLDESEKINVSFNIETTIDNTLKLFKNQHKDSLELESSMDIPKAQFIGNPVRIKQLILNLIENLIKIQTAGKLKLGFTAASHAETDEMSRLEIKITCPAVKMSMDDKQNYFIASPESSVFSQDIQKNYLDFSIARKIVELHSGSFSLTQENNQTLIAISLLLKKDKKTEPKKEVVLEKSEEIIQPVKLQDVKEANILLVEDNAINQKIVILSLKNKVKSIEVANNGKEALDKFGTTKYDIILMDIQMPVMNGIIATKKIRELESSTNTHTPIIAITANALSGDKEACLAAGMNDYVSKPFQVDMLIQKMQNLISSQSN